MTTSGYDAASRKVAQISALGYAATSVYDTAGRNIAAIDPLGNISSRTYDVDGRTIATIDPLGHISTSVYDHVGRSIASIDALGNISTIIYDAAGRTAAQQNALGFLTSFSYDIANRRIAMIDANSHATTTIYDAINRILATQDPLGALTSYSYDLANNQTKRIDARGFTTSYSYDADNRQTGYIYNNGIQATFAYDSIGRHIVMSDWTGVMSYSYDSDSRPTSVVYPTGKTLTYAYNANGSRTTLTDPDGGLTTYAYDPQDRLVKIANPFAEITTIAYDPLSRETKRILANGVVTSHSYDAVSNETSRWQTTASGTPLTAYTTTYDAIGNRLNVAEIDSNIVSYSYDPTYQLNAEQRSGPTTVNASYTYDGLGNRLTRSDSGVVTNYAYNAANAMTLITPASGSPTTLSYDSNGNLTLENLGGALTTYTWDSENRLITRSDPTNGIQTSTYDANGLRSKLITSSSTTYFVRDEKNVLQEAGSNLVTVAQYTDNPGNWGGLTSMRRSGASSFYGFDLSSNTRLLTNTTGTELAAYLYDAFGIELSSTGSTTNFLRYAGEVGYWRDLADWIYVRARVLDTVKGRWDSRDLQGFGGGDWNLYRYVDNRPVQTLDPTGLAACILGLGPCDVPSITTNRVPCPSYIANAKTSLCNALKKLGLNGILASKCLTGPKQAQCLLDWCNSSTGYIYCLDGTSSGCQGSCAFTGQNSGTMGGGYQCPDIPSYACIPNITFSGCAYNGGSVADTILHERIHACGTIDNGLVPDPAGHKANCLSKVLGV
jgi:RHS repeat-associated protein